VDLSGRSEGYRGIAIRCPGCADPMTAEALAEAEVDVCGSCGGMWVDWFDGEVRRVAVEVLDTESSRDAARASRPSAPTSSLRSEAVATGACPRCTRQLVVERYVVSPSAARRNESAAREATTGADLLRCEECAGVFVPRTTAHLLSALPADEPAPASSTEALGVLEPLPWERFLALLKRLIGLGDPPTK
jgi:Zn-finger nucleic acid-binding protein